MQRTFSQASTVRRTLIVCAAALVCSTFLLIMMLRPAPPITGDGWLVVVSENPLSEKVLSGHSPVANFVIKNEGAKEIDVKISRQSCSCFSSFIDGIAAANGHVFVFAPQQSRKVSLRGKQILSSGGAGLFLELEDAKLPSRHLRLDYQYAILKPISVFPDNPVVELPDDESRKTSFEITYIGNHDAAGESAQLSFDDGPLSIAGVSRLPDKEYRDGSIAVSWQVTTIIAPEFAGFSACRRDLSHFFCIIGDRNRVDGAVLAKGAIRLQAARKYGPVAPKSIHFGVTKLGDRTKRVLSVSAADGASFAISGVDCSPPFSILEYERAAAPSHRLLLSMDGIDVGSKSGQCLVHTDHEGVPFVSVELSGLVAGVDQR
jgi:hypothetical protein